LNKRRSSATKKKAESETPHGSYQQYFDEQLKEKYDVEEFKDEEKENEIDYLSENEIEHRNDESNIYNLIRRAKRIEKRIKQINFILTNALQTVTHENLIRLQSIILNGDKINEDTVDGFKKTNFDFQTLFYAFQQLEDKPISQGIF
jgi:uncharacterized membrane protein YcgQ (UPF0703/DUF1980 family)